MTPQIKMRLKNKGVGEFRAESNVLWLYDEIASDQEEAMWIGGIYPQQFIDALAQTTGPVTLRINSPGGSVFGAQAMIAAMRAHPHPITAQVDSLAASAASVIASAAAKTVMAKGSMLMIHKAWSMSVGNESDMRATADFLSKVDGLLAENYAARSNGDPAAYLEMMAAETWFTPEEAVAAGLADSIIETNTQRPAAMWDLSAYAKAPPPQTVADLSPNAEPEPAATEAAPKDMTPDLTAMRARLLAARLASAEI